MTVMGRGDLAISPKESPIHNEVADGVKRMAFCSIRGTHLIERSLRLYESHPFGFPGVWPQPFIAQVGFELRHLCSAE